MEIKILEKSPPARRLFILRTKLTQKVDIFFEQVYNTLNAKNIREKEELDMLTQLGIFLRKLRLDKGEILKDMATKLNVSSSFLSAVENGKKRIPQKWFEEIPALYQMTEEQEHEFRKSIAETEKIVEINLENLSVPKKEFVFSLARKLETADDDIIRQFKILLAKNGGNQ